MQTFDFGLVRNSDFGMRKLGQLLDGLALGGTAICCGNDTQAGPFAFTEFFQIFKKETKTGPISRFEVSVICTSSISPYSVRMRLMIAMRSCRSSVS